MGNHPNKGCLRSVSNPKHGIIKKNNPNDKLLKIVHHENP